MAKPRAKQLQNNDTPADKRTYIKEVHMKASEFVSYIAPFRTKVGKIEVQYALSGKRQLHKCPRGLSAWLDGLDDSFIKEEIAAFRSRVNLQSKFDLPAFYVKQKRRMVDHFLKSAKGTTVSGYVGHIENHILPFFFKLKQDDFKSWNAHYFEFEDHLTDKGLNLNTRNLIKSSLRRFPKYQERQAKSGKLDLPRNEVHRKKHKEGKRLPGERLPSENETVEWLQTLPPGRTRFVISNMAIFGVRISDALDRMSYDLIGADNVEQIPEGTFEKTLLRQYEPTAMLRVATADKRRQMRKDVKKIVSGSEEDDCAPKGGPYIAATFNMEMAQWLSELVANGEDKGTTDYGQVVSAIRDSKHPLFSMYNPHDFRRLNITHHIMLIGNATHVARLHGQVNERTVWIYYQQGLELSKGITVANFRPITTRGENTYKYSTAYSRTEQIPYSIQFSIPAALLNDN